MTALRASRWGGALLVSALAFGSPAAARYSGGNKVIYKHFDYQVLHTEHFDICYYPSEEQTVAETARMAERRYSRLSGLFDHQLGQRQPVELGFAIYGAVRRGGAFYGPIPVEAAVFADAGVASRTGDKKLVKGVAVALRANAFGFFNVELDFVNPWIVRSRVGPFVSTSCRDSENELGRSRVT